MQNIIQVLVPESQLSPEKSEEEDKLSKYKPHQLPGSLRTLNKNNSRENCRGGSSKVSRIIKAEGIKNTSKFKYFYDSFAETPGNHLGYFDC